MKVGETKVNCNESASGGNQSISPINLRKPVKSDLLEAPKGSKTNPEKNLRNSIFPQLRYCLLIGFRADPASTFRPELVRVEATPMDRFLQEVSDEALGSHISGPPGLVQDQRFTSIITHGGSMENYALQYNGPCRRSIGLAITPAPGLGTARVCT